MSSFRALAAHDRQQISASLLAFLAELESLILTGFGEEVPGSRAEGLAKGNFPSDSQGPHPGRNAMETVLFSTLAGIDHARLFARSLLLEDAAFGLATLTRGSVEAYARAWWFIEPQEDLELVTRWLSGLATELEMFARLRPDAVLHEMRGRDSNAAAERERVLDDLERLTGSRKVRTASYTAMASALGDQWKANGRVVYSDLSGVAHGESLGLHSFIEADDIAGVYRTSISDRSGAVYASWVLAASSIVGRNVLELLGRAVAADHPCAVAHDAAARTIAEVKARARA